MLVTTLSDEKYFFIETNKVSILLIQAKDWLWNAAKNMELTQGGTGSSGGVKKCSHFSL